MSRLDARPDGFAACRRLVEHIGTLRHGLAGAPCPIAGTLLQGTELIEALQHPGIGLV
ncbi:hypothetical protein QDY28_23345 [Rhizobium sp. BR 362]